MNKQLLAAIEAVLDSGNAPIYAGEPERDENVLRHIEALQSLKSVVERIADRPRLPDHWQGDDGW